MSEELKRCPFCGGEAELHCPRSGKYFVQCADCGACYGDEFLEDATGSFEYFNSESEAISAWNNLCTEQEVKS